VVDVVQIELDPLFLRKHISSGDDGKARDPQLDLQSPLLKLGVLTHLLTQDRAWSHKAHLTSDYVEQLRKLVEANTP